MPPQTEAGGGNLRRIYARGLEFIHADLSDVFEQAIAYFRRPALGPPGQAILRARGYRPHRHRHGSPRQGRRIMNGGRVMNGKKACR